MNNVQKTELLGAVLRFEADRNRQALFSDAFLHIWKLRHHAVLFPDARCPFCGEIIHSNRIWIIDAEGQWLYGQYQLSKQHGVISEAPMHPHASAGGALCLGDTENALEALFFGMNPNDPVQFQDDPQAFGDWLAQYFDHQCDFVPDSLCQHDGCTHHICCDCDEENPNCDEECCT